MKISWLVAYIDNFNATYTREIEQKPKEHIELFLGLAFAIVLLFGIIGLKPITTSLIQKFRYESELKDLEKSLERKVEQLILLEDDLKVTEQQIEKLQSVIPNDDRMQEYLTEFIQTCAKNGFIVKSFKARKKDKATEININLDGQFENIDMLVKDIENLERITSVENIRGLKGKTGETNVNVRIRIYSLEKEK